MTDIVERLRTGAFLGADIIEAADEIERLRATQLTPAECNRLRQWYNALDDISPEFLEDADVVLATKIMRANEQKKD